MRVMSPEEYKSKIGSQVHLSKETFDRTSRREYVTDTILRYVNEEVHTIWVYDDTKMFEDKNAMFQCIKNIVNNHPQLQHMRVWWTKGFPYVYIFDPSYNKDR